MKLTLQQLIEEIAATGRCLMMPRADYANLALTLDRMVAEEASRLRRPVVDWIRVKKGEEIFGHILIKPTGGKYQREAPSDVDPDQIPTFVVDPNATPATSLVRELRSLVTGLSAGKSPGICDTDDTIVFDGSDLERRQLAQQLPVLDGIHRAAQPGFDDSVLKAQVEKLRPLMFQSISSRDMRPAMDTLALAAAGLLEQRRVFAASCPLCGWFIVYRDVCAAIESAARERGLGEGKTAAAVIRYLALGCGPGGVTNPSALLHGMAAKMARERLDEVAAGIAERHRVQADRLIDEAIAAPSRDKHGDALYRAGLYFFVANRIFKGLTEGVTGRGLDDLKRSYAKNADAAEERQVRVSNALLVRLQDRAGLRLWEHRGQIAAAREQGGDGAANDMLDDMIDSQYFYPRSFESALVDRQSPVP
jgi:hypothetical protein